ncbi:lipocalin family protein [Acinetobacter ursingii]|uniref:Outer membrane lipoprotein Blc n=1 Tax=Acinetobacter ursingii TaxID=108980 RepID=A0AA46NWF2_9GAMM|nr:lipocalin family protein [Acinetobacter ursingii]UYF70786.1 lipocalin family protein [Acinetobacter ursingii]
MSLKQNLPKASWTLTKIAVGGIVLTGLAVATVAYAQSKPLPTVERVELDKYLGVWYEIARKPMYFEKQCAKDITATYTLNENGNVTVDNRCYSKDGVLKQSVGEAFAENPPFNTKLKVSFLPEAIRWVPVARGDYWILKLDENYQTVLVGEPSRKYLWVLSRTPELSEDVLNEYLSYAKSLGYDLNDIIRPQHTLK